LEVLFFSATTVLSFKPKFRMVSIIPGIETLDPDLTETSKGFDKLPNSFLEIFSITPISFLVC
jgi:hypothetical protein